MNTPIQTDSIEEITQTEQIEQTEEVKETKEYPTELTIHVYDNKRNKLKSMDIKHIDYTKTRIKTIKRAMNKMYSIHPAIKNIQIKINEDENTQSLNDTLLLSELNNIQELYAYIKVPITFKSIMSSLGNFASIPIGFIKKYLFDWTLVISVFIWFLLTSTKKSKIVLGIILFINYLIVKEVIPIQFTYDEKKDSKLKPLLTFFISLYPNWEIYNPLHNNIIEYHEKKEDEKKEDNDEINDENNQDESTEMNNQMDNQIEERNNNQNQSEMVIRKRIIEENDDDIEFNDVDHSTSDDE